MQREAERILIVQHGQQSSEGFYKCAKIADGLFQTQQLRDSVIQLCTMNW